jgi:hypothetical protein
MAEQELDLLQFSAGNMAQLRARAAPMPNPGLCRIDLKNRSLALSFTCNATS